MSKNMLFIGVVGVALLVINVVGLTLMYNEYRAIRLSGEDLTPPDAQFFDEKGKDPVVSEKTIPSILTRDDAIVVALATAERSVPNTKFVAPADGTKEYSFGWVVNVVSEQYQETKDVADLIPGVGLFAVERNTGKVTPLSSSVPPEQAIAEFESRLSEISKQTAVDGVIMDAKILNQTTSQVTVEYTIHNNALNRIFVFDQLLKFDDKGEIGFDQDNAYVFLENNIVRLVRGIVNPPLIKSVSRRTPIVASILEAGESKTETMTLGMPTREYHPFFPPMEFCEPKLKQEVTKVLLQIGWIEEQKGITTSTIKIGEKELMKLSGGWNPLQHVLEADIPAPQNYQACMYLGAIFDRPQLGE